MASKRRILIVDDNKELCKNFSDILELKGYEVKVVHDGYKAIEIIKNDKVNVVLMDIKMPGMSGIKTLNILREIAPNLNVILITAFADDIIYKEGLKNVNLKIIQKPIDIDKLLIILEKIC